MYRVGLTGGIGSGKSTVAQIFRVLDIPVFVADEAARELLEEKEVIDFYVQTLGSEILSNGSIDRAKTASILFQFPQLIEKINAFIHPLVEKKFEAWCSNQQQYPYIIKESAILFETGLYQKLHYTILVTSPRQLRIERLQESRNMPLHEIERRMQHQWPDEKKMELANWIVQNDYTHALLPQVINIHEQLISKHINL